MSQASKLLCRIVLLSSTLVLVGSAATHAAPHGMTALADERIATAQTLTAYDPTPALSGTITVAGSETMQPMIAKLAAEFMRLHPEVKFTVEGIGSSAAIREFALGISLQRRGDKSREGHGGGGSPNLLASSRELTEQELKAFASHRGFTPVGIPIALDAVTIYVNAQNPIEGMTLEQLDAIFSTSRKRGAPAEISTWGQVGLNNGLEKQEIHLYGRNKESGTREFFVRRVLDNGLMKDAVREQPGTASEILAIARDPLAIGYGGAGMQTSFARVVPIAEQAGRTYVLPTQDSVATGTYPLTRSLYLYLAKNPKERTDPAVLAFLNFINSREGQQAVARAGFFPLTDAMVAKNRDLLHGVSLTARTVN